MFKKRKHAPGPWSSKISKQVQSVDMFGKKVGFVKLKSEVYDRHLVA